MQVSAENDNYHSEVLTQTYWIPSKDRNQYIQYRLPGIVVSQAGTVIIYGEARTDQNNGSYSPSWQSDQNQMDIYLRRSVDGGRSFEPAIYIGRGAEYAQSGYDETINNPVMTVGNDGRLHLMFSCGVGAAGLWYCYSEDDGETWTNPQNIKDRVVGMDAFRYIVCGPGHGVCLDNGRLLMTAWVSQDFSSYPVYTIYSDDNGMTWKLGDRVSSNADESTLTKLSGGGVLISSRQHTHPYTSSEATQGENSAYRMMSHSQSGIGDWSASQYDRTLPDPSCCAGMCYVDLEGLPYAILHVNCASKSERTNVTVRCSFDDGLTWEKSLELDADAGGYSDIAVDKNGKVYVVYERNGGQEVMLSTFSFYDVFCADDPTLTNPTASFDSIQSIIAKPTDVSVSTNDTGNPEICVEDTWGPNITLNFKKITRRLNVSERPCMAIRIKATVASDSETIHCGVLIRSGRVNESDSDTYLPIELRNDGAFQTVIVDLSQNESVRGNLYSIELQLNSALESGTVGDLYEIEKIGFFENADEAYQAYGGKPIEQSDDSTGTAPSSAQPSNQSGCGSALIPFPMLIVLIFGCVVTIFRKKPLYHAHK